MILKKKLTLTITNTMTDAFKEVSDKIDRLNTKIDSMETRLNKRIDEELTVINNKLSSDLKTHSNKLIEFEAKLGAALNKNLEQDITDRLNELERIKYSTDLIINGLPKGSLNFSTVFLDICKTIGFNETGKQQAFRLQSGAAVIKFYSTNLKDIFFNKYLRFKTLNLSHIGFTGEYTLMSLSVNIHLIFLKQLTRYVKMGG